MDDQTAVAGGLVVDEDITLTEYKAEERRHKTRNTQHVKAFNEIQTVDTQKNEEERHQEKKTLVFTSPDGENSVEIPLFQARRLFNNASGDTNKDNIDVNGVPTSELEQAIQFMDSQADEHDFH